MSELIGADIESVKKNARRRMEEAVAESCCPHCRPRRCPCCGRIIEEYPWWERPEYIPRLNDWYYVPSKNWNCGVTCHA